MEDYSKYVPNVIFEQIPIKNLVSSQDYQRNLSMKHVKKAVENFDLYQINPVKVSRRNGGIDFLKELLPKYPVPVILLSGVWSMTICIMNMKPTSLPIR